MSLLWELRRFVDVICWMEQRNEARDADRALPPDFDPDSVDEVVVRRGERPRAGACRVCGHEGAGAFCPRCLAATMVPKRR